MALELMASLWTDGLTLQFDQHALDVLTRVGVTKLVLADEPTGALDSHAADQLLDLFHQINERGQTIVMVTHSAKAASNAKRVLFLRDGEVFHQLYRADQTKEQMYQKISDTLTMITTGGERHE